MTQGYRLSWGKVVRSKRDVNGNQIVQENQNPILDTRQYEVKFTDIEVTELTANVIAGMMYAQCDKDVNGTLLIDSFLDYIKIDQELSFQDQQRKVNGKPCMECCLGDICPLER